MHPAPSIIFFTVFSGLGFGLLAWMGLGLPDVTGWVAFVFFALAYLMAVGGLISSTFHLGNPQRALRAFTQWRTSWLSREGWLAVLSLLVMAVYGAGLVFLGERWTGLGILGSFLSLSTVFATSMIYGQLKTVPRWNAWTTPALFMVFAVGGGALMAGQVTAAIILLILLGVLQFIAWTTGDARFGDAGHTMETATGLGPVGKVRLLESPHSGGNYLLREMVHVVGRKHARKLRILSLTGLSILPVLLLLLLPAGHIVGLIAVILHLAGTLGARWLFFAEAEHVVGLYYGKR